MAEVEVPITGALVATLPERSWSVAMVEAPPSTTKAQFMQMIQERQSDNPNWEHTATLNFGADGWLIIFKVEG